MFNRLFNRASLRIFLALLLVALTMFISNYIVFKNSITAIYDDAKRNNRDVGKNMVRSFDACFKEVNNMLYNLYQLNHRIYEAGSYENVNMSDIFVLFNDAKLLSLPDYITEYIIYFESSNLVVTPKGTANFNYIFNEKYKNIMYPPEFWRSFSSGKHLMKIIPSSYYSDSDNVRRKLIGIIGNNKMSSSKMNIAVFIDENKLLKQVNGDNMMKDSSLIVLDQDKNIMISTDGKSGAEDFKDLMFKKENELTFRDEGFEYYCIKSGYNDFIYIYKIKYSFDTLSPVMKQNRVVLFVTIFLGVMICFFFSIYLYRPIKGIFYLIESRLNGKKLSYIQIYNSINQIQNENKMFKNKLDLAENEARRGLFFKMVYATYGYKELKHQLDEYFESVLLCNSYVMVSFEFELRSSGKSGVKRELTEANPNSEGIECHIQGILRSDFKAFYVFHIKELSFTALIGLKEAEGREIFMTRINSIVKAMAQATGSKYIITAAVSRFHSDMSECKKAFKELELCSAFGSVHAENCVMDYEAINFTTKARMPADFPDKLSNHLLSGNGDECKLLIEQIFETNISNDINYVKLEDITRNIFNIIMNTLSRYEYDQECITKFEIGFFEDVIKHRDYKKTRHFFWIIIDQVTEKINDRKQSKLSGKFIHDYINLHYIEDLCLEHMAQITGTSPKYFSSFFKKAMGGNFVDYLNKVRISHAKELLKKAEMPIGDIGKRVGYPNLNTFARTFKKYCGISPSEYKKDSK